MDNERDTMYGFKKVSVLARGGHEAPEDGMCIMELVSFINREPFSDRPKCVDRSISLYMQNVNDTVTSEERVKLLSVIDRMFHTGERTWDEWYTAREKFAELWPWMGTILETEQARKIYIRRDGWIVSGLGDKTLEVWGFILDLSMSAESVDVKLAVLNRMLDIMDEVMGVEEILPQNREEIEKMLEGVQ